MALKKYCCHPGCNRIIDISETYCHTHSRTNAERNADYDRVRRDKKAKAFYNSAEWKVARAAALARDCGIDVYLYVTERRAVPATMVHHIVELKEDYTKRVSANNLISVSEETHEKTIKKAYANGETKKEMQRVLRHCIEEWKRIKG